MSKRKYKPTKKINSLADFENCGCTWFQLNLYSNTFRMWHRAALMQLPVKVLLGFIDRLELWGCTEEAENDADIENN